MAKVAIIGAGPAGLFAAEFLAQNGHIVSLYDAKPTAARKFLMAGHGGLNLTHSEPLPAFLQKYRPQAPLLLQAIEQFTPHDLRAWALGLGQETFVGSSGRVFPESFKASPLLRAWLHRLSALGVTIHYNAQWIGFDNEGYLKIAQSEGRAPNTRTQHIKLDAEAVLLALGGASWPKLGSTGAWVPWLEEKGIDISRFQPSNCGFEAGFSAYFAERFKGVPLKRIALRFEQQCIEGELMIDGSGVEGGAIYALSAAIRTAICANGAASVQLDLKPDLSQQALQKRLERPRGKQSTTNFLRKCTGLSPVALALLREAGPLPTDAQSIAARIKTLTLELSAPRGLNRAISSAGGIKFTQVDKSFMLKKLAGVFVAGEMLDWEAPTGGYLLQGVFATAQAAAQGINYYLKEYKRQYSHFR
ncbi:NAD(P)/FAD-dependent oxidoreductase [Polycladidibacter hongkongensis]|uniref:NAD(P)/FAD-dependent oxidoreductase n=1 Tax=Polycladidibacter hongkongensis TaxID=1647556 RepID=UPI00083233CF|nr:TIGR03862 family flavoprotein [Pseudovibrio hongkongensis]